jgi:SAM-dependent methyltransferase
MGADKVGKRYRGKGATGYEAKRAGKEKWILENKGVETLLPLGIKTVLDVPIGTGRFYTSYRNHGLKITGVDTSPDMLKEAKKKGITDLHLADIRKMPFPDKSFDLAVCIRLFGWFEPDEVLAAMKEMARVANILIIGNRTKEGEAFCKSNSLWNHSHTAFLGWIDKIGYKIDDVVHVGNKGNSIYRMIPCE